MLPSSSNCYNPCDHYMFKRQSNSFHYDQNPNPKQDDPSLFASFPSPIFNENELPLNQILSHHQPSSENHNIYNLFSIVHQIITKQQEPPRSMNNVLMSDDHRKEAKNSKPNNKETNASVRKILGVVPRRRTGKKDRHSKICTAQGIRDRRMRLSLQVARKFFDLQDLLGYDKASKTIEWLFNESKDAISELMKDSPPQAEPHDMCFSNNDAKSESLISECEVVSGIDEHSNGDVKDVNGPIPVELISVHDFSETKIMQKNALSEANQSKGSREEARARARCRTREKMRIKGLDEHSITRLKSNPDEKGFDFSNPNEFSLSTAELVSSSNTTLFSAAADHRETTNNHIQERRGFPQLCVVCQSFEPEKFNDADTIEKLLGYTTSSSSSSCPIAHYQCFGAVSGYSDMNAAFMGFRGNYWDTFNNEKMSTIQYEDTSQVSLLAGNPNSVN